MHRKSELTKHERKARQLRSEAELREKAMIRDVAKAEEALHVETACKVFEQAAERSAFIEKGHAFRLALLAKNPVVLCRAFHEDAAAEACAELAAIPVDCRVPFAALPMQSQVALTAAWMRQHGKA